VGGSVRSPPLHDHSRPIWRTFPGSLRTLMARSRRQRREPRRQAIACNRVRSCLPGPPSPADTPHHPFLRTLHAFPARTFRKNIPRRSGHFDLFGFLQAQKDTRESPNDARHTFHVGAGRPNGPAGESVGPWQAPRDMTVRAWRHRIGRIRCGPPPGSTTLAPASSGVAGPGMRRIAATDWSGAQVLRGVR